ncbi:MAG: phosphate/phosphite/phosphonate ABC transporter substrate-binding protein [Nitrospirae bacterium]|nr:MAG: phosphate/phosphite/phosphonate ABC transporter substrate-binding protein [Nitrospirota bacterium]
MIKKVNVIFPFVALMAGLLFPVSSYSQQNTPVKIGVASMITPVDAVKYYQEIIDYVGEQIKQPVQMVHRRTYEEMDSLLETGSVKVAFICSAPYVKNREQFGIELIAAPSVNGKAEYHSYIIVHKDSPMGSFQELKGKTFAFTDPKSNTGKLYPEYLLKKTGQSSDKFFKKHIYSYSHNKSVELVAKKVVDGAAVESIVYEYMHKKGSPYARQTKIIKRSESFGIPPVVVTKDIDPVLKKKIKEAFLNMHRSAKGKQILGAMMVDGFVQISDKAYDSIRKMERAVTAGPKALKNEKEKQTIYFGVIPRDNPRILYEKYQPLIDYLSEKTPYAYELVIKKNYEDTVNAIGSREIDIALLGPLTYLEAHSKFGAISVLKPKGVDGAAVYKSVIIRKKGLPLKEIKELKGKSVAFAASKSTSGNLMARYLFANSGIHLSDLGNYANFDYHDTVVKAVLKGQYDAGAVRDSVAKKYMKLGIEVVAESEPIPVGPITISPGASFSAAENIKKALLELDPKNPVHEKILKRLDDDLKNGFTETSDKDYEGIRTKINAVPQTCGRGCHPKIRL